MCLPLYPTVPSVCLGLFSQFTLIVSSLLLFLIYQLINSWLIQLFIFTYLSSQFNFFKFGSFYVRLWISVFMCKLTHSDWFPSRLLWFISSHDPGLLTFCSTNSSDSDFSPFVHQLLNPSAVTLLCSHLPSYICSPHHATVPVLLWFNLLLYSLFAVLWSFGSGCHRWRLFWMQFWMQSCCCCWFSCGSLSVRWRRRSLLLGLGLCLLRRIGVLAVWQRDSPGLGTHYL